MVIHFVMPMLAHHRGPLLFPLMLLLASCGRESMLKQENSIVMRTVEGDTHSWNMAAYWPIPSPGYITGSTTRNA